MQVASSTPISLNCDIRQNTPVVGSTSPTVGDRFLLVCKRPEGYTDKKLFQSLPKTFFKDPKDQWNLFVLNEVSSTSEKDVLSSDLVYEVTSYKAGDFKNQSFLLTDGIQQYTVENLSWTISSVLKDDSKPYPVYPGYKFYYPLWFWLLLGLSTASLFLIIFKYFKKRKRHQNLLRSIFGDEAYKHSLLSTDKIYNPKAFIECSKNLRSLQKKIYQLNFTLVHSQDSPQPIHYLQEMDELFRNYIQNEMIIDTLNRPSNAILKHIKSIDSKMSFDVYKNMHSLFKEIEAAHTMKIHPKDILQIFNLLKKTCEGIHEYKKKRFKL